MRKINNHENSIKRPILFVHYGDNWLRGSEIVLLDLLKAAQRNNYTPVLWCNSEVLANKASQLGITVIQDDFVCIGYWTKPRWHISHYIQQFFKAKDIIQQHNIALVHCNNGAPCQWMALVCKLMNIPLVLHLHARYMYRDRLTLLFHGADRIVGVSQSVISLFKDNEFSTKQLSVIYNGVHPQRAVAPSPRNIRVELSASDSDFVILFMGSLIPRKSVHQLLYAVAKLKESYSIKLAVVGSGSEEPMLKALAKKLNLHTKVQFFDSSDEVGKIYASNVDCFISVPTEEVFGLTLAEASIAKLPIITTNIVGINEIYTNKKNALLVSPNNIDELAHAIKTLIDNPLVRATLADNAHKHILKKFSLAQQFNAFDDIYQTLLQQKIQGDLLKSITQHTIMIAKAVIRKCYQRILLPLSTEKK